MAWTTVAGAAGLDFGGPGLTLPGRPAAHTEARLVLAEETARPGDTVLAGVRLRTAEGWHTYWKNAGESGIPTEIKWNLPDGVTAGGIQWPVPDKFTVADITTYGLHGETLLLVPLTLGATVANGVLTLKAQVKWLECADVCLPGKADVAATLTVGDESRPSQDAALFEEARKKLPSKKPAPDARAWWDKPAAGETRPVVVEWSPAPGTIEADFYPFGSETFVVKGATEKLDVPTGKVRLRKPVEKIEGDWPTRLGGLLIEKGAGGKLLGACEVTLPVADRASSTTSSGPGPGAAAGGSAALLLNLGLAFLGGLILNLMPCVLPVIALKILSFVNQSGGSPARTRKLGLVYGVGVLVSLLVLGGLVVAVQQAGHAASWGMQFQNPKFVVAITTVIILVALNLFGVFEITLGGGAMGAAGALAAREGAAGAFFNGVLAVVLATPCTAPFLATALGFAFAQPAPVILLSFAAVAVGLALPYVVLSFFPQLLRFLPKPGRWMERFKIAMGFPMLGTAVWLFTVAWSQLGEDRALGFGLFLVALALAGWIWGEFVQRGTGRRGWAQVASIVLVSASGLYAAFGPSDQIQWQPWSGTAVAAARSQGRPVLVDFTARWCLTCKANKRTSLEIPSVRQKLKEINAVALLGDYTREDPAITAELQRFERAGVPLVLVYPKDAAKPPLVLPALLTPSIVLEALDKAVR